MTQQSIPDPVFTWMRSRRSIRHYQPQPVPRTLILELLEAACWAPSAHNRQPWRFAILTAPETKERLALAMGDRLRADLTADGLAPDFIAADIQRSYQRLTTAPAIVLVALSLEHMDRYPDPLRNQNEWQMAVQSTAMAGQNFLLAAHAAGLGACWLCAPLFCPDTVRFVLGLPDHWQPQGLITLGYPAEERIKSRKPLAELILDLDA